MLTDPIVLGSFLARDAVDEYAALDRIFPGGYQFVRRSPVIDHAAGRWYDRIDLIAHGRSYIVWFDVTSASGVPPMPAGQATTPSSSAGWQPSITPGSLAENVLLIGGAAMFLAFFLWNESLRKQQQAAAPQRSY
jgi:hypothetical protein